MTTETFPFNADGAPIGPDPDEGGGPNRRALAIGGAVLALAVAGGGYLLLAGGGGGDDSAQGLVPHGRAAVATSAPAPAATHHVRAKLPVYKGAPAGRDPFKPLVTVPPPQPVATTPTATPTTPNVPVVGPGTGGSPGTGGGTSTTPTPQPTRPAPQTVLVFKEITFSSTGNKPLVQITYNGKSYALATGATVGGTLKVLAIQPDDSMAVFQVGDQTFDLRQGQAWIG